MLCRVGTPLTGSAVASPKQSSLSPTASDKHSQNETAQENHLVCGDMEPGKGEAEEDDGLSKFEVCEECNKAREEEERFNQLHFSNRPLYVKHVAKVTEASSNDVDHVVAGTCGRRKSRRSRAGKAYQTYTVLASSDETLSTLKLKVSESEP